jgi:uncharacterized Zn-finger protein
LQDCKRTFSRKQDLVRHEKGPHQNGSEKHYCPHAECVARNPKPFSRKDNLMKHLKNKHSQNKSVEDEQEEHSENIRDDGRRQQDECEKKVEHMEVGEHEEEDQDA